MNKFIALFMIVMLTNTAKAKTSNPSILRATYVDYDDKILETTCLGRYTGVFHSFVYFANNQSSTDYYVIRTSWLVSYPKRIKEYLKNNNMYIYDKNPVDRCGWVLRSNVDKAGICTGSIYTFDKEVKAVNLVAMHALTKMYPSIEMMMIFVIPITVICVLPLIIYCIYDTLVYNRRHRNNDNYYHV